MCLFNDAYSMDIVVLPGDLSTGAPSDISNLTPQSNGTRSSFLKLHDIIYVHVHCIHVPITMHAIYINFVHVHVVQVSASTTGKKRGIDESQEASQHK